MPVIFINGSWDANAFTVSVWKTIGVFKYKGNSLRTCPNLKLLISKVCGTSAVSDARIRTS
eukprot:394084-Amphidinium_carterae.1